MISFVLLSYLPVLGGQETGPGGVLTYTGAGCATTKAHTPMVYTACHRHEEWMYPMWQPLPLHGYALGMGARGLGTGEKW